MNSQVPPVPEKGPKVSGYRSHPMRNGQFECIKGLRKPPVLTQDHTPSGHVLRVEDTEGRPVDNPHTVSRAGDPPSIRWTDTDHPVERERG